MPLGGPNSQASELFAFSALGIRARDVVLSEEELGTMTPGTVPEIVARLDGSLVSVEVKRIPENRAFMDFKKIGCRPFWHWNGTVRSGLTKMHAGLLDVLAARGIKPRRHILVLLVPATMGGTEMARIGHLAGRVHADCRAACLLRAEIRLLRAPPSVF